MPVPVISVAQMRAWEQATWASGQAETTVIARVGHCLAQRALALTRHDDSILLLTGRGHNGDDARAMLPHLAGRQARLLQVIDPVLALAELDHSLASGPKLIVDGLFGIGLNRELDRPWTEFIARVNEARLPVLAVDVPSGLDADTGKSWPTSIRATFTATVGAPKRGLLAPEAVENVGRLEVMTEVGLLPCPVQAGEQWTLPTDFESFPPPRPVTSHKGTFGHLAIVAGSLGYHGASVLAARSAQRARPGLITLFTQPDIYHPVAAQLQAVMVHPWKNDVNLSPFTGLLFGPGLATKPVAESIRPALAQLWNTAPVPVIVDASALDWLPPTPEPIPFCRVITPHPGEAARLLSCTTAAVQSDRPAAVRALSRRYGNCWVVLKGHQTLIGRSEGELWINSSGHAGLAQGGTGDLLAGFLAGWLAQSWLQNDPVRALRYAVWEHGAAADRLSTRRENWIVEELADELGANSGRR